MRQLHRGGHTAADLSDTVIGPRIYDHEGIPSALAVEEVQKVLDVPRPDLTPTGLRDHVILMLLATTPIVRALVCEDSETALQTQHRLPPFGSFLG